MREVINPQMKIGQTDIGAIQLNLKSRDDIPHILLGLQHIYTNKELRDEVFQLLEQVRPLRAGKHLTEAARQQPAANNKGRPGMEQWKILVLGTLRLGLNTDYDRICELANEHKTIRKFLGHSGWLADGEKPYQLQTIKDNISHFTPEIFDQINQVVVRAGHSLVKKSPKDGQTATNEEAFPLYARADSFVVLTNVHYPTDLNLLYDAVRKTAEEAHKLTDACGLTEWRQYRHLIRSFKRQYRTVQQIRRSTSKDEHKRSQRETELQSEVLTYLEMALDVLDKSKQSYTVLQQKGINVLQLAKLKEYQNYIELLQNQIHRRLCEEKTIPHEEKVFSIFEPHTEWITKGKAGVPVELGLRVSIVEDQYRFILHHQVMQKQTDDKVAVPLTRETKERYPQLQGISFDKGYHSPTNQRELQELVEQVTLPKKGKRSDSDTEREQSDTFKHHRRVHSAVESAINALEHNGLDRCPDHGIDGFKRYVALAIVSRNIKRLGQLIRQQAIEKEERRRGPYKKAA